MKKVLVPGLVAGVAMLVIGTIYSMAFGAIFPAILTEYQNPNMFRPWSDPLMQIFFAYPFVLGLALAWVWDKIKGLLSGSLWHKALNFALAYVVVATIPGMFITYTSFVVSLTMITCWTISGFVYALVAGLVLGKMNG